MVRVFSIPAIRDRVVQGALKLLPRRWQDLGSRLVSWIAAENSVAHRARLRVNSIPLHTCGSDSGRDSDEPVMERAIIPVSYHLTRSCPAHRFSPIQIPAGRQPSAARSHAWNPFPDSDLSNAQDAKRKASRGITGKSSTIGHWDFAILGDHSRTCSRMVAVAGTRTRVMHWPANPVVSLQR